MRYHWTWISQYQIGLFEDAAPWKGSLPAFGAAAAINQGGASRGAEAVYRATGGLLDREHDYASFREAMRAVEAIVEEDGGTVLGP